MFYVARPGQSGWRQNTGYWQSNDRKKHRQTTHSKDHPKNHVELEVVQNDGGVVSELGDIEG